MSKEKQIEEIDELETVLYEANHKKSVLDYRWLATEAYNEGYRKQSEVIDEFAKRLKEAPIKFGLPLFDLSTKAEIEEHFNDIMLQVRDAIDGIAKEMKGGAE